MVGKIESIGVEAAQPAILDRRASAKARARAMARVRARARARELGQWQR